VKRREPSAPAVAHNDTTSSMGRPDLCVDPTPVHPATIQDATSPGMGDKVAPSSGDDLLPAHVQTKSALLPSSQHSAAARSPPKLMPSPPSGTTRKFAIIRPWMNSNSLAS
jgi:hypothetical protein